MIHKHCAMSTRKGVFSSDAREGPSRQQEDVLETAIVTATVRSALKQSNSLFYRVREHLRDALDSYRRVRVGTDSVFRVATRLAVILHRLQASTGVPLGWHERPLSQCYSYGVIDPGVTRPALGRFYFRIAVEDQEWACACARPRASYNRRHRCFCEWLRDSLCSYETVGPETDLGLSCAQNFQYWSGRQLATLYAWVSLRTLCLLAELVSSRKALEELDRGAFVMAAKVARVMETNKDYPVLVKRVRRG